ncbi:MAG TPA: ArsR family transcriptional regulator [Acidimicrobiia bacterium]
MVVGLENEKTTDLLFHALSDSTRRDIIVRAMVDDYSVSGLADFYAMSFAAVQKHVAVLERAGLITKHRRGREQLVRSNKDTIRTAYGLLEDMEKLWRERIDRMGEILAEPEEGEDK